MKKVLKQIARQLESLSFTVAALESASLSENYGGRQLTAKQLTKLKLEAKRDQKEVFDGLKALIQSLPTKN